MELTCLRVMGCYSAYVFNFDPESSLDAISSAPDQHTDSTGSLFSVGHHLANSQARQVKVYMPATLMANYLQIKLFIPLC